jgi:anti-sigma-K factor RskA
MDAVAGADRARFERHLARCQACALELRGLREATARLAGAVAAEPPAVMIEQALAAAARTRQLPPVTGQAAARRTRRPGRDGGASPAPFPGRAWRALLPRLALALAAVFLAAAAASGTVALNVEHRLGADQLRDQAVAQVLNAPDAVMLTARVRAGGTATVVMSRRDRSLVLTTAGLPPMTGARCYQLWLMGPSGDRSAGMLPEPRQGMTSPVIAAGLAAGDWVGLTVEPAGGSPRPTSKPILMLSLPT